MQHPHSSINNLLSHLQNVYTTQHPDNHKTKSHSQNPFHTNIRQTQGGGLSEMQEQEMKERISKIYKNPWRANGIVHSNDFDVRRLPAGDLDNWEIYRINLAQRSYNNPKNYKGMKIPSVGKQFTKYDCKDKEGHMPYLYESDFEKINRIRNKIYSKPFRRTNTVKHELFGFPKKAQKRPISQINLKLVQKKSTITQNA